MKEIWRTIEDYPDYQISNMGRVKSLKWGKEKILNLSLNYKGYYQVGLRKDGKRKLYKIHRLIAQAFIPNPENKPQIDHINTIKTDNRVENLRWVTNKENCNNLLTKENYSKCRIGNLSPSAKSILQFSLNGELVKKWDCMKDVERELGFYHQSISSCCLGKLKTANGYKWGYADDYEKIPFKVFDLEIYRKKVA